MGNMTYEQFAAWCEHWGYTVDEGYKAMCFVHNILGQHFNNKTEYVCKCEERGYSEALLSLAKASKDKAISLYSSFCDFDNAVFSMLEKHDKEAPTTCDKFQPKEG